MGLTKRAIGFPEKTKAKSEQMEEDAFPFPDAFSCTMFNSMFQTAWARLKI